MTVGAPNITFRDFYHQLFHSNFPRCCFTNTEQFFFTVPMVELKNDWIIFGTIHTRIGFQMLQDQPLDPWYGNFVIEAFSSGLHSLLVFFVMPFGILTLLIFVSNSTVIFHRVFSLIISNLDYEEMARVAGLEPATFRLTIGCATIAPHPNTETRLYFVFTVVQPFLAGGAGFEPAITESKSVVLPVTPSPNKEDWMGNKDSNLDYRIQSARTYH